LIHVAYQPAKATQQQVIKALSKYRGREQLLFPLLFKKYKVPMMQQQKYLSGGGVSAFGHIGQQQNNTGFNNGQTQNAFGGGGVVGLQQNNTGFSNGQTQNAFGGGGVGGVGGMGGGSAFGQQQNNNVMSPSATTNFGATNGGFGGGGGGRLWGRGSGSKRLVSIVRFESIKK
jgi:hypothetical protein